MALFYFEILLPFFIGALKLDVPYIYFISFAGVNLFYLALKKIYDQFSIWFKDHFSSNFCVKKVVWCETFLADLKPRQVSTNGHGRSIELLYILCSLYLITFTFFLWVKTSIVSLFKPSYVTTKQS